MPQMKKAVITFDPERISQINIQAEGEVLAYIIREGLLGRPYATTAPRLWPTARALPKLS